MEDPLTEDPPPSRFFDEDLNNFTPPSPPLPPPSLHFSSNPSTSPSLFIIALSSPSLHLVHHLSSKTLIGTLTLPELTTPKNKSISIYSLNDDHPSVLFVSVQCSVSPERSHAVAKLLLEKISPEKVVILESIQSRNFRGRLPPDEELMFKLETLEEKSSSDLMVKGLDYFPSGSLIDGLAAAVLVRCQMNKIRATLCVSWPESGRCAVLMVKNLLERLLPQVDFSVGEGDLGFYRIKDSRSNNSEMYT